MQKAYLSSVMGGCVLCVGGDCDRLVDTMEDLGLWLARVS